MKQYPIWNKVTACTYKSSKSWGARETAAVTVKVGSSSSNSNDLLTHMTTYRKVWSTKKDQYFHVFKFGVDGVVLKAMIFYDNRGRAGELYKQYSKLSRIKGLKIEL